MRRAILLICSILISFFYYASVAKSNDFTNNIESWIDKRNKWVVKQNFDYSCGASSLATILNYFYNVPKTEQEILQDIGAKDNALASFKDLSLVTNKYGFEAKGIITNFDFLKKIKIPAIIHINYKREAHFSVVRFIDSDYVYLADSKWGNKKLSHFEFKKLWYTSLDDYEQGRVLLILPTNQEQINNINNNFFTKHR